MNEQMECEIIDAIHGVIKVAEKEKRTHYATWIAEAIIEGRIPHVFVEDIDYNPGPLKKTFTIKFESDDKEREAGK